MLTAVGAFGPNLRPLSYHEIKVPLPSKNGGSSHNLSQLNDATLKKDELLKLITYHKPKSTNLAFGATIC